MKALVTGATGFIGGNLVKALLERGYAVRALLRPASDPRNIAGLDVELAFGDLRDIPSLERALAGCDYLFHVAAVYTFWTPDPDRVFETNVTGTENVLAAARRAGVKKVVYTSTESTVGMPETGGMGTEALTIDPSYLAGAYKQSKYAAERVALHMARDGLPLVVVNPTTPVGPGDVKPTPTGQIVVDFINGKMPAFIDTGLNLIDVRDVAAGHVLAVEKGRVGERYILGHENLSLEEILRMLGRITGLKAPSIRIPIWLALGAAYVDEYIVGRVRPGPPRIPIAAVKAGRRPRHFDCSKAVQELGLPQTPVEEALAEAVKWFGQHGYSDRQPTVIEEGNFDTTNANP
jgi:dihydroflavonol-4-reductase